ncbi:MAG TPA: TlpA disulfide reductase family protein [Candidatus Acidoferrales bacterium]|jgi:thiol-disulfide isomerase/thioredoxin|nr:TlpA disulfide reductase family protein [Candidatus Acidoferrales bacterium]
MKKVAIIVCTVLVLVGLTFYVDKATRLPAKVEESVVPPVAAISKPAPELKLKDLDGKDVALADLKGKVVFVNFWATWCGPCQEEIPSLIDMQNKYASKGFTVLGIAMDDEGKSVVAPFVAKEEYDVHGQKMLINYPIVIGSDEAADKFGGILGYPTSFLISRSGKQIMKFQGPPDPALIEKAVESAD